MTLNGFGTSKNMYQQNSMKQLSENDWGILNEIENCEVTIRKSFCDLRKFETYEEFKSCDSTKFAIAYCVFYKLNPTKTLLVLPTEYLPFFHLGGIIYVIELSKNGTHCGQTKDQIEQYFSQQATQAVNYDFLKGDKRFAAELNLIVEMREDSYFDESERAQNLKWFYVGSFAGRYRDYVYYVLVDQNNRMISKDAKLTLAETAFIYDTLADDVEDTVIFCPLLSYQELNALLIANEWSALDPSRPLNDDALESGLREWNDYRTFQEQIYFHPKDLFAKSEEKVKYDDLPF